MGEKVKGISRREAACKAITAIVDLLSDLELSKTLKDVGVKKEDFSEFAENVLKYYSMRHIEANPRPLTREDIIKIYENAWKGKLLNAKK
jgi:alcohol dehydrogenase